MVLLKHIIYCIICIVDDNLVDEETLCCNYLSIESIGEAKSK